jgi:hypothetical protein
LDELCEVFNVLFDKELLPKKTEKTWTEDDTNQAVQDLMVEKNTHFDDLIKNLEHHPDLYQLAFRTINRTQNLARLQSPQNGPRTVGRLFGPAGFGRGFFTHF